MSEIKLPFTQTVGIVIASITVIVALAGYVLFFQSQSRLNAQIKAANELKEKYSQADNTLNEMKSKYDNVYEDMKKVLDDLQDAKAKFQDCQQKYDALESRYDALSRQSAANPAPGTTTTPGQDHPVNGIDNSTKPIEAPAPVR